MKLREYTPVPGQSSYSPQRSWLCISTIVAFATGIWLLYPELFIFPASLTDRLPTHNDIQAPKANVWGDFSDHEAEQLHKFLYEVPNNLNLSVGANATGNSIFFLQALRPNKTDVRTYMNDPSSLPKKWAHLVTREGTHPHLTVNEYMVGPLPVDDTTTIAPLTYLYNSGKSFTASLSPGQDMIITWGISKLPELLSLAQELFGDSVSFGNSSNPYDVGLQGQIPMLEYGRIVSWCSFLNPGTVSESPSLLIQGLYMKIDVTDADLNNWDVTTWMYNGIVYNSTNEFRRAIKDPAFEKTPFNLDGPWTMLEDFGPGVEGRELPPPVMVQTTPPRYGIDRKQDFVSWMGFEFYIAFSQVTGITLYDIRFKEESIIYELGLQEALAHYAGDDPMQGNLIFLDTYFGMGGLMFELVPGYDCPAYASFLDVKWWREGKKMVSKNSICLFEYTADYALQRHTASQYVSVSRNTYFVVRSVATVGNYDYTIEYLFYLDGTIEVKIRASGFIFSSYWSTNRSPGYGFRVHDQVATSLHTHVLNFKADVDVAGFENSVVRIGVEPTLIEYPWDALPPRNTMHLTRQTVVEEAGFNWPSNSKEIFFIGNNNSHNVWGQKRGYTMRPGTGMGNPVHLVIQNSTALGKAAEWATMDFWIVKQKDTELKSTSQFNALDIHNPLIDFSQYVNGENIEQEDLVIYFNLGGHHVPHSGDIPNTLMHTSASSIMFVPHNFHDRDPSRQSSTGVRLDVANRSNTKYYGGRIKEDLKVKLSDIEPDMRDYNAKDHPVRKFT